SFHDAPNTPSESQLLARLRFTSKTARVMTYAEYYRRTPNIPPPLPNPWLHLCLPASRSVEYANRVLATPAEVAFSTQLFAMWRTSSIKRPLARVPKEDLVVRFQLLRRPPASFTDIGSRAKVDREVAFREVADLTIIRETQKELGIKGKQISFISFRSHTGCD